MAAVAAFGNVLAPVLRSTFAPGERTMPFRIKLILAAVAMSVAVGLLVLAGARGGWVYYLSVDQFTESGISDKRVRLHGIVGSGDFEFSYAGLWARFDLHGESNVLRVEYEGVIPDNFRPGHEVITEGRRNGEGVFIADTLMTKCGSRYESDNEPPATPYGHPLISASEEAEARE
jgi:cytochrome c-type biogenesis protein CcmE